MIRSDAVGRWLRKKVVFDNQMKLCYSTKDFQNLTLSCASKPALLNLDHSVLFTAPWDNIKGPEGTSWSISDPGLHRSKPMLLLRP